MVVIGNLLVAIGKILDLIISVGYVLFIIRAVISWIEVDKSSQYYSFLINVTEPVLEPIRKYLPGGAMDFSPMAAMLILYFADIFVVESLLDIGFRLK
ncbi:MAG: YggT family protein [Candidatus Marinimicrobia bacterium]|nr:YggT family protein [Candidatus Neomarinimicrobiota bacterium]